MSNGIPPTPTRPESRRQALLHLSRLPICWHQLVDLLHRHPSDRADYVPEVLKGIDAVAFAGLHYAVEDRRAIPADVW